MQAVFTLIFFPLRDYLYSFKFFDSFCEINGISSQPVIRKVEIIVFLRTQEFPP